MRTIIWYTVDFSWPLAMTIDTCFQWVQNLFTDEKGIATFKGIPFMTSSGPCTSSINKGSIKWLRCTSEIILLEKCTIHRSQAIAAASMSTFVPQLENVGRGLLLEAKMQNWLSFSSCLDLFSNVFQLVLTNGHWNV